MALSAFLAASLFMAAAAAAPLAAERWNKRVVLVFGSGGEAERQIGDLLADREALAEREMLVIAVSGEKVATPFGTASSELSAGALRDAYAPAEPFTVVLIGKDGGEKLRRAEFVAAKDIFGLIDSMPMRQSEVGG